MKIELVKKLKEWYSLWAAKFYYLLPKISGNWFSNSTFSTWRLPPSPFRNCLKRLYKKDWVIKWKMDKSTEVNFVHWKGKKGPSSCCIEEQVLSLPDSNLCLRCLIMVSNPALNQYSSALFNYIATVSL